MFTGLTSQVSSWMGAAKGETQEEEVPTPTGEGVEALAADGEKKQSPTKGSRLEMFTNVKSQMTGWLGSGIPGLRKGGDADGSVPAEGGLDGPIESPASERSVRGSPEAVPRDDDDNSSATGGADSGPASAAGTPTDEQGGQIGAAGVTNKAVAGAKSFGNFLYSAVNKAGAKVSEAGAKIKKTVEENSLLGEFNKEQDAFIKGQQNKTDAAVPPWVGCPNEESLKEECLSLSTDRRNFVRAPPAGVDYNFDYDISYPIAISIMAEDPNLEKMRFDLVPKVITEECFWKNYFYRISLICQANELSAMGGANPAERTSSIDQPQEATSENISKRQSSESEFVSDNFRASEKDIEEVREGMKRLGMDATTKKEEDWERELEAELQDYEVVADGNSGNGSSGNTGDNWEKDVDDLLGDDTDLK